MPSNFDCIMRFLNKKWKPSVPKSGLLVMAGLMWMAVGTMMSSLALGWLAHYEGHSLVFALPGFLFGLIVHHFGFLKVVDKNLGRISKLPEKPCAFSFMAWKSYLLVAVMMTMGISLRHSSLPKQYLSVIYLTIGIALFLSSIRYFIYVIRGKY